MRKKTKLIALTAAVAATAAALNKGIYKNAEKKLKNKKSLPCLSHHTYEWKFGTISYKTTGSGKPILLVHSLIPGASGNEWIKNVTELSKVGKVYLIDLLGYGNSERARITYSAYLFICLINDFITEIIKEPTTVIASNTSAAIASMAYIFNKNNFNKLCLIYPPISPKENQPSDKLKNIPADIPILGDILFNSRNTKSKIRKQLETMYKDKSLITDNKIELLYSYSHKGGGNNRNLFSSFIANRFDIGIEASFPEIEIPLSVAYGDSIKNAEEYSEIIKNLNKTSELKLLKGKNFPHEEDSDDFNNFCKNFITL